MKQVRLFTWICVLFGSTACAYKKNNTNMQFSEVQLTKGSYGHFLNSTQVFSPGGEWIVFDTRNVDGGIGETPDIQMVNTTTGEIKTLYHILHQTKYGPGVGAATFSPVEDLVLFIHGIRNANESKPYGFTRRTAVAVKTDEPLKPLFYDARQVNEPFIPGALRGGTHAYSWSGDGQWLSFTYNDYVLEQLAKKDSSVKDLRTIAVMAPGKVVVPEDATLENNSGEKFSAVVAAVVEHPTPGSDEIDKAFDEGWVGKKGYKKADGTWQNRAVAFQGNVRNQHNETVTEVFITDIPDDITKAEAGKPLEGTATTRPNLPAGVQQRRLTHTTYGVVGPRHWLKSTSDGEKIFFLSKDSLNHIQVYSVSPNGGSITAITQNPFSVQGPINISPNDRYIAYVADNSAFITEVATGVSHRLTARAEDKNKPEGAVIWNNTGAVLAFNRRVPDNGKEYVQIFLLKQK